MSLDVIAGSRQLGWLQVVQPDYASTYVSAGLSREDIPSDENFFFVDQLYSEIPSAPKKLQRLHWQKLISVNIGMLESKIRWCGELRDGGLDPAFLREFDLG